jgi:hypothetical protein
MYGMQNHEIFYSSLALSLGPSKCSVGYINKLGEPVDEANSVGNKFINKKII